MSFMPDFGKIAETATNIDNGLDRIDSRLTEIAETLQSNNALLAFLVLSEAPFFTTQLTAHRREQLEAIVARSLGPLEKLPFSPTGINGDDDGTDVQAG